MSNKATQQERDFAIVMQQLSAEAEKILPGDQSKSLPEVRDPAEPTGGTKRVHRGGQLEIALQQFTNNGAQLECARLFLQRSRLPDRLRMRLKKR